MNLDKRRVWVEQMLTIEPEFSVTVSVSVYPKVALFRACYLFTGRCWIWLTPAENGDVVVNFMRKHPADDVAVLQGDFANVLIDQAVRWEVERETRDIRSTLIATALAEASSSAPTLVEIERP